MPDFFYVYPSYLDRAVSRRLGRRVPASEASADVTVEAITAAARALGYTADAEANKQYPRQAHQFGGRVKIAKPSGVAKSRALHLLAARLRSAPPVEGS